MLVFLHEFVYQFVKKKAYVRITTTLGDLNCELHADYVPRTVENFIKHCQNNYYDGTLFHRNIRSFIIQVSLKLRLSIFLVLIDDVINLGW